ncbi:MAG: hypothetical protein WB821_13435 [Burkholderiaceae bacterium]
MNLLSLLIAPLQAVVLFFAPHAGTPHPSVLKQPGARLPSRSWTNAHGLASGYTTAGSMAQAGSLKAARITYPQRSSLVTAKPIHRVRVVRNLDSSLPADRAGRMVVSGRFADVCAELDRLIALQMRAV